LYILGVARTGRPKTELTPTEDQNEQLVRWSRRAKSSQALALRSKNAVPGTINPDLTASTCARNTAERRRGQRSGLGAVGAVTGAGAT
jgi:hypothetical protein